FQVAPDEQRVVYRADQHVDQTFDLYSARTDGQGSPRRLTAALGGPGSAVDTVVFGSGGRIVFQWDSFGFKLYSVPLSLTLPPLELDSSNYRFLAPLAVSADGLRAVYRRDSGGTPGVALRSARIDGSAPPIPLADPLGTREIRE